MSPSVSGLANSGKHLLAKSSAILMLLLATSSPMRSNGANVSWSCPYDGDWYFTTCWSPSPPGPDDDVTINDSNRDIQVRVVGNVEVRSISTSERLLVNGPLRVREELRYGRDSYGPNLRIQNDIIGATLRSSAGGGRNPAIVPDNSNVRLVRVDLEDLDLNAGAFNAVRADIEEGLTINGAIHLNGIGSGGSILRFVGAQTLSGPGEIVFEGSAQVGREFERHWIEIPGSLTIDSSMTIRSGTEGGFIGPFGGVPVSPTLINYGRISSQTSNRVIHIRGSNWVNRGTLEARNGGRLELRGTFELEGTFIVDANSVIDAGLKTITRNTGHVSLIGLLSRFTAIDSIVENLGSLSILGGRNFSTIGPLSNSGLIHVGAASLLTVGSGALTHSTGGKLVGNGAISGALMLIQGALAPGQSVGTLSLSGANRWEGGGSYEWEVSDFAGTEGSAPGWDLLAINGPLQISADATSRFRLRLISLASGNSHGLAANFDDSRAGRWRIITASGGIEGFDSAKFTIDLSGFQNPVGVGSFSLGQSGNDVWLFFTVPPPEVVAQPQNQTVTVGNDATFAVSATGVEPMGYQWRKGDSDLAGQTNTILNLSNAQVTDAGDYTVVVSNAGGSITSVVARLTVLVPPMITTQPFHQTVAPGSLVTFTVIASGSAPLTYQWRFNGTNIAGATDASLMIPATSQGGVGFYSVVVGNAAGSVESAAATLSLLSLRTYAGLTIAGPPGTPYRVDYATDLTASNWMVLTNLVLPTSPHLLIDADSPLWPKRFYRAFPESGL